MVNLPSSVGPKSNQTDNIVKQRKICRILLTLHPIDMDPMVSAAYLSNLFVCLFSSNNFDTKHMTLNSISSREQ